MSIQEKVVAIIAHQAVLEPADIDIDAPIDDLGLDSLGMVEAIYSFEETFDISVPYNANEPAASDFDISTVRSIISAVEGLVAQKAS